MDCAACALKIENAIQRLPGVTDIEVSFTTGTLVQLRERAGERRSPHLRKDQGP
ncbi:heavy-metal-associated domain-containing protein [Bradyrhizobium sp. CNPSo 4026]|nr:heavy-metal-associated domain-containing protein [Bradyrhizobium cenepequi]